MRMEKRRWLWFAVILAVLAGFTTPAIAGSLEPGAAPGPTMKTLDEIPPAWSQKLPAAQRFQLVLDSAAVLDKETGLVWEKSPGTTTSPWSGALYNYCYNKEVGGRKGWRPPTIEELSSLVDLSVSGSPRLSGGHPFLNVQSGYYWSATTLTGTTSVAWFVNFNGGYASTEYKTSTNYVWCVRGGHGYDGY